MKAAYASLVLSICLSLQVSSARAFDVISSELQGNWGTPEQCSALQEAADSDQQLLARNAPYSLTANWLFRGDFYCAAQAVVKVTPGPSEEVWRARVLCKEDAGERPWQIDIIHRANELTLSWTSRDPDDPITPPWVVGPLPRCTGPES
ncbi:MAG: hypothetical protein AAGH60_13180 [Pseudomonadota bacterium]